jgi:ankyrin repeat protein
LIQNNADIHSKDIKGRTPLHLATFKGHGAVVNLLLEHEADVGAKDNESKIVWLLAIYGKDLATLEMLLAFGAADYSTYRHHLQDAFEKLLNSRYPKVM